MATESKGLPWVKIMLGVVALYVAAQLGGRGRPETDTPENSAAAAAPAYSAKLVSLVCDPNYGRPRADVTIQNTGPEIPYATVFVSFGKESRRSYFRPTTVPSGATAEATMYASDGAPVSCSVTAMQDGDGRPVNLSK